jgi:hypothetical protein
MGRNTGQSQQNLPKNKRIRSDLVQVCVQESSLGVRDDTRVPFVKKKTKGKRKGERKERARAGWAAAAGIRGPVVGRARGAVGWAKPGRFGPVGPKLFFHFPLFFCKTV